MRVLDVRCYAAKPDESDGEGSPPIVAMAFRVGAMHFTFRLPMPLAWAAYGRLGEAITAAKRLASPERRGEGGNGKAPEQEGPERPPAP